MNLNQARSIVANSQYVAAQKVIADFEAAEAAKVEAEAPVEETKEDAPVEDTEKSEDV